MIFEFIELLLIKSKSLWKRTHQNAGDIKKEWKGIRMPEVAKGKM
jgi:hypothetical protein